MRWRTPCQACKGNAPLRPVVGRPELKPEARGEASGLVPRRNPKRMVEARATRFCFACGRRGGPS